MKTSDLDFDLPEEKIAVKPAVPRDSAKLLILKKNETGFKESTFLHLGDYLKKGDLLVFNETKVFPARIFATKTSGGRLEVLFLEEIAPKKWEVLIGGRTKDGQKIFLSPGFEGIIEKNPQGTSLKVEKKKQEVLDFLQKNGQVPLPPYIKREATSRDREYYQTVFAKKVGSAAAPTASLHFTERLLAALQEKGVETAFVTLHVGLGTFAPVKTENLEDHNIHSENFEVSAEAAQKIAQAKKEGRRVIAVGTTVARTLESLTEIKEKKGSTRLFITPGFQFRIIDGLITNFHTPRSSLLGLVYAFAGEQRVKHAYQFAKEHDYRFFSYGDGMLLL